MSSKEPVNISSFAEGTWYNQATKSPEAERLISEIYEKDDFGTLKTFQETIDISIVRKVFPGASLARCRNIINIFIGGIYNFKIFPESCLEDDEIMRNFIRDFVASDAARIIAKLNIAFSSQRIDEREDIISLSRKLYIVDEASEIGMPIGVFLLLCAEEKPRKKIISELSGIPKECIDEAFGRLKSVVRKCLAEEKDEKKSEEK